MTERKKILLVSNGFYPEISPRSYRATELAKEFSRQGHSVVVITKYMNYDYSDFLNKYSIIIKLWGKSKFPKVPDFKRQPFSFIGRAISRTLLTLFEYPGIEDMFKVKRMLKNEGSYDMLISFAVPYPVHWGVAWARTEKLRVATTWIADCGDPYMGDILDSFRKPFYFGYLEKYFCRKADFISIPVQSAMPGYFSEFHHKIRIIPQGFDFDYDFNKKEIDMPVNDVPTFAYAGRFLRGARDPDKLMHYLINLDLPFKFFVYTNNTELLTKYKNELKEKLFISEFIPRDELMKVLAKMDFLINFDNNTTLNSPSKLIDYTIAGRPILNITQNLNEKDLLAFISGDYRNRMILSDPLQYHIKNISRLFLDLLLFKPF
jgi:hypothetical protein